MDMCFACIAAVLTNHRGWRIGSYKYKNCCVLCMKLKGQCAGIVYACLYVIYRPVLLRKCMKLMSACAITMEERWKDCAKRGLRNRVALLSMGLNSKKLISVCGRAVISRSERNVGAHVDNRLPTAMHSQVDIHKYSVANI